MNLRLRIQAVVLSTSISIVGVQLAHSQASTAPSPNMPSAEEMGKFIDALPAEKRKQLSIALDELALINDLQSGTCSRAPEVSMKVIQGDPESIYLRSEMYLHGWCITKDTNLFHADLEQAARLGVASASFDLGVYLLRGDEGYERNVR